MRGALAFRTSFSKWGANGANRPLSPNVPHQAARDSAGSLSEWMRQMMRAAIRSRLADLADRVPIGRSVSLAERMRSIATLAGAGHDTAALRSALAAARSWRNNVRAAAALVTHSANTLRDRLLLGAGARAARARREAREARDRIVPGAEPITSASGLRRLLHATRARRQRRAAFFEVSSVSPGAGAGRIQPLVDRLAHAAAAARRRRRQSPAEGLSPGSLAHSDSVRRLLERTRSRIGRAASDEEAVVVSEPLRDRLRAMLVRRKVSQAAALRTDTGVETAGADRAPGGSPETPGSGGAVHGGRPEPKGSPAGVDGSPAPVPLPVRHIGRWPLEVSRPGPPDDPTVPGSESASQGKVPHRPLTETQAMMLRRLREAAEARLPVAPGSDSVPVPRFSPAHQRRLLAGARRRRLASRTGRSLSLAVALRQSVSGTVRPPSLEARWLELKRRLLRGFRGAGPRPGAGASRYRPVLGKGALVGLDRATGAAVVHFRTGRSATPFEGTSADRQSVPDRLETNDAGGAPQLPVKTAHSFGDPDPAPAVSEHADAVRDSQGGRPEAPTSGHPTSSPDSSGRAPAQAGPDPNATQPLPSDAEPLPNDAGPVPHDAEPIPNQVGPAPNQTEPARTQTHPAPTHTGPSPNQARLVPNHVALSPGHGGVQGPESDPNPSSDPTSDFAQERTPDHVNRISGRRLHYRPAPDPVPPTLTGQRPAQPGSAKQPGPRRYKPIPPTAALPTGAELAALLGEGIHTRLGGVIYLINLLERLRIPDRFPDLADQLSPWAVLDLVARGLLTADGYHPVDDPIWLALAHLDRREPDVMPGYWYDGAPPDTLPPDWLDHPPEAPGIINGPLLQGLNPAVAAWLRLVLPYIRRRLMLDLEPNAERGESVSSVLLLVPGVLFVTSSHVDLVLDLEAISMPVRMAGLDANPGWLPAYGRVIYIHFQ